MQSGGASWIGQQSWYKHQHMFKNLPDVLLATRKGLDSPYNRAGLMIMCLKFWIGTQVATNLVCL